LSRAAVGGNIKETLEGREFEFSPLRLTQLGEATAWAMRKRGKLAREILGEDFTAKMQSDMYRDIMFPQVTTRNMLAMAQEPDSSVYLLWLSAKSAGDEISLEEFEKHCTTRELEKIAEITMAITFGGNVDEIVQAESESSDPLATAPTS
jgi:hypothetical protein